MMTTESPFSSPDPGRNIQTHKSMRSQLFLAYLPLALVLSGVIMFLFGLSWWTTLIVILLLACPAAIAVALYSSSNAVQNRSRADQPD
jgi:membrane protein implicated in regulation of membrane protease activity